MEVEDRLTVDLIRPDLANGDAAGYRDRGLPGSGDERDRRAAMACHP